MATLPYCLKYLELTPDADERSIRRTYARRLKQIDADQDPQAFQALREAYEAALNWAASKQQEALPTAAFSEPQGNLEDAAEAPHAIEETLATPQAANTPAINTEAGPRNTAAPSEESIAAADEVFETFISQLRQHNKNLDDIKQNLESSLNDMRLINLEARDYFEWRLICWLTQGWQAGNEALIGIATNRFHWDQDRQRLYRFGRPGEILDCAIHELTAFKLQAAPLRNFQLEAIRKLRSDAQPKTSDLIHYMPVIEQLARGFPTLLPIITNRQNMQRWRTWENAIPGWRRWLTYKRAQPATLPGEEKKGNYPWFVGLLIVVFFKGIVAISNTPPATSPPSHHSQQASSHTQSPAGGPLINSSTASLQSLWTQQIQTKIRLNVVIPKGTPAHAYVEFLVVQRPDGVITQVTLNKSSGFREYDQAMQKAIQKSSPLPLAPNPQAFTRELLLKFSPAG